jgi:hypothetical protein
MKAKRPLLFKPRRLTLRPAAPEDVSAIERLSKSSVPDFVAIET